MASSSTFPRKARETAATQRDVADPLLATTVYEKVLIIKIFS